MQLFFLFKDVIYISHSNSWKELPIVRLPEQKRKISAYLLHFMLITFMMMILAPILFLALPGLVTFSWLLRALRRVMPAFRTITGVIRGRAGIRGRAVAMPATPLAVRPALLADFEGVPLPLAAAAAAARAAASAVAATAARRRGSRIGGGCGGGGGGGGGGGRCRH